MSRIQPVQDAVLFRGLFVFTVPPFGKIIPKLSFEYPPQCSDNLGPELMGQLPKFAFPYEEKSGVSIRQQKFTFVFTDAAGTFVFGYCFQGVPATPASDAECICLVTQRPYDQLFDRIVEIAGEIWHRSRRSGKEEITRLLQDLHNHFGERLTPLGPTMSFTTVSPNSKTFTIACNETPTKLGYSHPVIGNRNVGKLLQSLSPANIVHLMASVLFERRIIVVSDDIGTATGIALGVERLCYPISWEGVFIPIMPNHLLDYCSAPMPFLAGVHSSNWKVVSRMPLEEVIVVDVDNDVITDPFDDHEVFPYELSTKLRSELKVTKSSREVVADSQIVGVVDAVIEKIIGGYRQHIRRREKDGRLEVDWDSFSVSKPKSYQRAFQLLRNSQSANSYFDHKLVNMSTGSMKKMTKANAELQPDRRVSLVTPPVTEKLNTARSMSISQRTRSATVTPKSPSPAGVSSTAKNTIKQFIAARPNLKRLKARVHAAVFLGSTQINDADSAKSAVTSAVKLVLDPTTSNCMPCPVLVMIYNEVIYIIEEKTGKLIEEISTISVVYFDHVVSHKGAKPVPMIVLLTCTEGLLRHGHVLATQTEKYCHEVGESVGYVCPYVASNLLPAELPALQQNADNKSKLFRTVRRVYSLHYVDKFRLSDSNEVNAEWVESNLSGKKFSSNETILVVTPTSIKLMDPFSLHTLHQNATSCFVAASFYPWPGASSTASQDTSPNRTSTISANSMRTSQAQRVKVMDDVKNKKITPTQAATLIQEMETKLQDVCLCYVWHDDNMDCAECVVLVCTDGEEKAAAVCRELVEMKKFSENMRDPFVPISKQIIPSSAFLAKHELNRDNLTAVKLLKSGNFGMVYMANQVVKHGADTAVRTANLGKGWRKVRKRMISIDGPDELPTVVKVMSDIRSEQEKNIIENIVLELKLNHENIVKVLGVCLSQKPWLKVSELMQYGDLKSFLTTCKAKGFILRPRELAFIVRQVADALSFLHSKQQIVHNNLSAKAFRIHDGCVVKVAGFSKARRYDEGELYHTNDGTVSLPYHYTPPESVPSVVFSARNITVEIELSSRLSEATDSYQFGVAVWEIITYGAQPYADQQLSVLQMLKKLATSNLKLTMPDNVDDVLAKLVESCTQSDATQRPKFSMTSLMLEKIALALSSKEPLRDVGHLVSPKVSGVLASVANEFIKARRHTLSMLQSRRRVDDIEEETSQTQSKFFSLDDWQLDEHGHLVRKPVASNQAEAENGEETKVHTDISETLDSVKLGSDHVVSSQTSTSPINTIDEDDENVDDVEDVFVDEAAPAAKTVPLIQDPSNPFFSPPLPSNINVTLSTRIPSANPFDVNEASTDPGNPFDIGAKPAHVKANPFETAGRRRSLSATAINPFGEPKLNLTRARSGSNPFLLDETET